MAALFLAPDGVIATPLGLRTNEAGVALTNYLVAVALLLEFRPVVPITALMFPPTHNSTLAGDASRVDLRV